MSLLNCIQDWGGFERLVADLNKTGGDIKVDHNVKIKGQSGAKRQIDVLITHRTGLYEHKIIVECKYWTQKIKRHHVDALITAKHDLGVSKGVFFTTKGYQKGAKTVAEKNNIDLFLIKELQDEDWGLPGRQVQMYLQIISRSIRNVQVIENAMLMSPLSSLKTPEIELKINDDEHSPKTQTFNRDGTLSGALEDIIKAATRSELKKMFEKIHLINEGKEGTSYLTKTINMMFEPAKEIHLKGAILLIPRITFDLIVKVVQSNISIDRMNNYHFVLMIENCISGASQIASKKTGGQETRLKNACITNTQQGEVFQNGSVFQAFTESWFDPKEVEGLTEKKHYQN